MHIKNHNTCRSPYLKYIILSICIVALVRLVDCREAQISKIVDERINLSSLDIERKERVINLKGDEGIDEEDPQKFSWRNHRDDHSLYAYRSLMSTGNIRRDYNDPDLDESLESYDPKLDEEEFDALKTIDYAEKEWQLMFRYFDLTLDGAPSSTIRELGQGLDILNDILSRLKPDCRRDFDLIRRSVRQHKLWALRMLDSNGKIPSGITYGRFSSPGDYEECLSIRVDEKVYKNEKSIKANQEAEHYKFHGKYCLIDFRLPLPERPRDKLLSIHDPVIDLSKTEISKLFPSLVNYSGYASAFYEVGYMHAFCLPSTCEVTDLTKSIGKALEGLHIIVNNTVDCEEKPDEPLPLRTSQIISITFLIVLFANATVASIMRWLSLKQRDLVQPCDDRKSSSWKELTINWSAKNRYYSDCFSIQSNFERLSKPDPRGLTFVHYTRIVAMALTVITHTAGLGTLQAITKPADTSNSEQIFRDFIPQMLANAFTSIQIFFFMAGFMLVISTYPSIKRERGHISFLEFAIKRAIRLVPGLLATICINFLWPLFVDGPMLSYFIRLIVVPCESNWWRTMSFLSNFDDVEKMCLRHSYFSASDYQLHIMAFPLLILLYKQPQLSLFIAGLLTCAGFVAQVIMILTKTVLPFMMVDYIDKQAFFNVVHYIHHPVWNHMSAFFYGFIIGFMVVKQIRINISDKTIKRLWYIILPLGIGSIFAPYFWNHYKRPIYRWQMVIYVLLDRFALLTACAWLTYASMVLGRKQAPKKPSVKAEVGPNLNLPNIVEWRTTANDKQDQAPLDRKASTNSDRVPNITRQRSSPNFQVNKPDDVTNQSCNFLRPALSSSNVRSESAAQGHAISRQLTGNELKTPIVAPEQESSQKKKPQGPISNVNTLCLILSRLTFQLYLFNMVVLWIDVNHSKYNWFFSYYFIITKACAVYICSSLFALVFFVTMESPSLTLYIMWVKSRAQKRANRSAQPEAAMAAASSGDHKAPIQEDNNVQTMSVNSKPHPDDKLSFSSHKSKDTDVVDRESGSSVELSVRVRSPKDGSRTEEQFRYIDLCSSNGTTPTTNLSFQTKM